MTNFGTINDLDFHPAILDQIDNEISNQILKLPTDEAATEGEVPLEGKFFDTMLETFDDYFLDNLKESNEGSAEDDFNSAMEILDEFSDSLNETTISSLEQEVSDSMEIFDKCMGIEKTEPPQAQVTAVPVRSNVVTEKKYVTNSHSHNLKHVHKRVLKPTSVPPIQRIKDPLPLRSVVNPTITEPLPKPLYRMKIIPVNPPPAHKFPTNLLSSIKSHQPQPLVKANFTPTKALNSTFSFQYNDYADISDDEAGAHMKFSSMRGRTQETFQVKLHSIIERAEQDGYASIISWIGHGRGFRIHNQKQFLEKILRRFFFQTKMTSFMRQLGMYGFHKIIGKNNPDRGCFFHELFLRGRPGLCKIMIRQGKRQKITFPDNEPNLTLFKPIPHPNDTENLQVRNAQQAEGVTPKEIHYTAASESATLEEQEKPKAESKPPKPKSTKQKKSSAKKSTVNSQKSTSSKSEAQTLVQAPQLAQVSQVIGSSAVGADMTTMSENSIELHGPVSTQFPQTVTLPVTANITVPTSAVGQLLQNNAVSQIIQNNAVTQLLQNQLLQNNAFIQNSTMNQVLQNGSVSLPQNNNNNSSQQSRFVAPYIFMRGFSL